MSELPPGFVLDQAAAVPAPEPSGLPPGFVLDTQPGTRAPAAQPEPSTWEKFKAGLGAIAEDPSRLGQVGPGRLVPAFKGAVTLPGDVYTGKVDPRSDEGITRAMDMAMFFNPMPVGVTTQGLQGVPRAAQESVTARIFGDGAARPVPQAVAPVAATPSVAEAAGRLGVEVPVAVASDSRTVQALGGLTKNVPFAGAPLKAASERSLQQMGESAGRIAEGYGGASVPEAGASVREAITSGWKGRTAANESRLYGRVDSLVNPQARMPLESTRGVVADILARRASSRIDDTGPAVGFVEGAIKDAGGLTYEGIKNLRTNLGEKLKNPQALASAGVSQQELRAIYGGLSNDLRASVQAGGGQEALSAFNAANAYSAAVSRRAESLQRIVGAKSDEQLVERLTAAASSKGRADVTLLTQARKAAGAEAWDDLAGAVVSRLGRDGDNNFSPLRFLTDIGKMSPQGRALLFDATGRGDLSRSLTDLATVSSRFKALQTYANPSGTAQNVGFGAAAAGLMADPVTTMATVLTGNVVARMLAAPAGASSMAKWATAYERAVKNPSAATAAALKVASKNLASTATQKFGVAAEVGLLTKALNDNVYLGGMRSGRAAQENEGDRR